MRTIINLLIVFFCLLILSGCGPVAEKELFVVGFEHNKTLTYQYSSFRTITLDLINTGANADKKSKPQKMTEKLDLVIEYTPVEVDPYGVSTIKGTCKSAEVTRTSFTNKKTPSDIIETLPGKTFMFKIAPDGKITDYTNLTILVTQLGQGAFSQEKSKFGRIKNPDMISDFIAMQWYIWDSIASIQNPLKGVAIGQKWKTVQIVPLPVPMTATRHPIRETTFKLAEIDETPEGKKAVITSTYNTTELFPESWPRPYSGPFQMKGMIGFLRNYDITSIEGQGRQIFNIDSENLESDNQDYKVKLKAAFLLPLGGSTPILTIDQKISLQLLEN